MALTTSHKAPSLLSIQEFTSELRKLPALAFDKVDEVHAFLREHRVNAETLSPYLVWDRQHYTRNLIDKTPLYELIAICWEVGQASSIHNHRGQNCWMAAPMGRLKVQNYRTVFQDLKAGRCHIEPAEELEMNASTPCA